MSRDFKQLVLNDYISSIFNCNYLALQQSTYEYFVASNCINLFKLYYENNVEKDAFTTVCTKKDFANAIFNEWNINSTFKINVVCFFKHKGKQKRQAEIIDKIVEIEDYKKVLIRYLEIQIKIMNNKIHKIILDET